MESDREEILNKIETLWNKHNKVIHNVLKPLVNYYELTEEEKKNDIFLAKNILFDHCCDFDENMGEILQLIENLSLYPEEVIPPPWVTHFEIKDKEKFAENFRKSRALKNSQNTKVPSDQEITDSIKNR